MTAQILDGKVVAAKIKEDLKKIVRHQIPTLAVVLIGDDVASKIYIAHKQKACEEVGIRSWLKEFPEDTEQEVIVDWIHYLNEDPRVNGILVQLPLPKKLDRNYILKTIEPSKDVDCFNPINQGLLMSGCPHFKPCTPAGIVELLKYYGIKTKGQHVCIVNNGILIGQPLATMLSQDGKATVSICHEYSDLSILKSADIIITAVGKKNYRLTAEMIKENSVIVDVGVFREGKNIRGDVVFEEVCKKASWVSPCVGGVGPLTIAMLLSNTFDAIKSEKFYEYYA